MTTCLKYIPKLNGWQPDASMKDAVDHTDLKFDDNIKALTAIGSGVVDPGVEVNGVLDLRKWCSPVEDQGQLGSCVANATVGSLEFLQLRSGLPLLDLSRLFIYYNARLMTQDQDQDEGTYVRLAMGTLSALGTCSEAKWSYDVSKVFVRPSWGSYREAYANKIGSYYRIDGSGQGRIDQIKQALQSQHPIVFGMTVDVSFMRVGADGLVPMPPKTLVNPGGHATLLVGYDDKRRLLIGKNSWGEDWGDKGYYYINYDHLDAAGANDLWVPTALK